MSRLYEAKHKTNFYNNVKSKESYIWLFDKTFDYEQKFGKDLFNFTKEEMLDYLSSRKMALSTLKVHLSYISSYINWAIEKGVKLSDRNIALEITNEDLNKIAKKNSLLRFETVYELVGRKLKNKETEEDIIFDTGLPKLKNVQDRLLIYLIFLGVNGERSSELVNLKFEHVDVENNILKLSELNPTRKDMKIDNFCIQLFKDAKKEQYYERYMDEETKVDARNTKEDYDILDSNYVFRKSSVGKKSKDDRLTYSGLVGRIITLSKYTGVHFTIKKIESSGMAYIAYGLNERGKLDLQDKHTEILLFERFNIHGKTPRKTALFKIRKDMKELYYNDKS